MKRAILKMATFVGLLIASNSYSETVYDFKMKDYRGKEVNFSKFRDKLILIVNVASGCGFTPQLGEMTAVYEKYKDKGFDIIAIPSNSFNQESLESIKVGDFCELKYKAKYTITEKSEVIGDHKIPLYRFLVANSPSDKGKDVSWNFNKFLINRKGEIIARFPSKTSPTSKEITSLIEKNL
jgi:glutathione peroxidase